MSAAVKILEQIEGKYSISFPSSYKKLVSLEHEQMENWDFGFGNCQFYPPSSMLKNNRYAEMPRGLFPFGRANGSEFCFFFGRELDRSEPPIVYLFMDTHDLHYIASSLRGFLWYEFVVEEASAFQFYDPDYARDFFPEDDRRESKDRIVRISEAFNIPYEFGLKPSPDREEDYLDLHRAFIEIDPHAAQSLCWIGKHFLDDGEIGTAEEYLGRSALSAPYLAAPHYFLAQIENTRAEKRKGLEFYWQTALCPLYLSGDAMYCCFDVGLHSCVVSRAENLLTAVFAALQEDEKVLSEISNGDPLADYVLTSEPCDEYDRADLAQKYQEMHRFGKAIREWENVLYLTWGDRPRGELALESLLEIYRNLGDNGAVAMHSDRSFRGA